MGPVTYKIRNAMQVMLWVSSEMLILEDLQEKRGLFCSQRFWHQL
jgi:hypothetical protein